MNARAEPGSSARGKGGAVAVAIAAIIGSVFAVEGGYVNDPNDPGGATNHGVTEKVARNHGYAGPMKQLPKETAARIYEESYIAGPGFLPIVELDRHVAEELVDTGANAGPGRASLWFQEALNHLNRRGVDFPDVAEDGKIGPGTVAAFAALQRTRGRVLACQLVLKLLDAKQAQHYARLASGNSKFETFMIGWTRTRIGNVDPRQCGK